MPTKFEGADGIRGLACLIVLLLHALVMFFPDAYPGAVGAPKYGVWLFFVLSAFLLTRKFIYAGFSVSAIFEYAVGRFLRIFPLFVLVLFVFWSFNAVGMTSWDDVKSALLFERGYFHLWTIPVEFKFYLILPVLAFVLIVTARKFGTAAALGVSGIILTAHQLLWGYWNIPSLTIDTIWYVPCFFMGCVAAVCYEDSKIFVTNVSATIVAVVSILILLLVTNPVRLWMFGMPYDQWLLNKFVYFGALWAVFIVFLIDGKGVVGRFFCTAGMRRIGEWSYSIYLAHWFFIEKYYSVFPNNFAWMAFCVVISIAVGAALYYAVESPIEKLRRRIRFGHRVRLSTA